jgi:hypothetical protein
MLINAIVLSNTDTFTFYCIMTGMCILASLFFLFLPSIEPDPEEPVEVFSFKYDIRDTCLMLFNRRMMTVYMAFVTTATNGAISGTIFTPMFVDTMNL